MNGQRTCYLRRFAKILVFLLILIGLLQGASWLVRPRDTVAQARTRSEESLRVFEEPEQSLDVLFFGHSGLYSAISPMVLYKEYGFTSYDCSQPLQLPWESARWLKALLKVQSPEVVVFEVDHLFYDGKTTVAKNSAQNMFYDLFPVFRNHANWKSWFGGGQKRARSVTKGYYYSTKVKPYKGNKKPEKTDRVYKIGKKHMRALEEVYSMCEKRGIRLMLLEVPSVVVWDYSRYNAVRAYAEKRGLDFVDLNQRLDELDFDWKTDTRDKGDHLNYWGARKVSGYVGKYLRDRYSLADRREDPAYGFWKEDLAGYEKKLEGEKK